MISPLPRNVSGAAAVSALRGRSGDNDFIYVIGGWNERRLDSVYRYSPKEDTYKELRPMTMRRNQPGKRLR